MRVTVKLFAQLRKFLPPGSDGAGTVLELSAGATVGQLLAALGIPPDRAGIIVSDDQHLEPTSALRDAQEVSIFPPLVGG